MPESMSEFLAAFSEAYGIEYGLAGVAVCRPDEAVRLRKMWEELLEEKELSENPAA